MTKRHVWAWIVAGVLTLFASVLAADTVEAAPNDAERQVQKAQIALESFLDDPNFSDMHVFVQNARAVLIVPEMLKGGLFFVGGDYGVGVLLVRNLATGLWSEPAFVTVFNGNFGLQLGGQVGDTVITLMNEGAVTRLLGHKVNVGGEAHMAIARFGGGVGASTTTNFGEDMYTFSRNQGLYGGFSLQAGAVTPNAHYNELYYGKPIGLNEIIRNAPLVNPFSYEVQTALNRF